MRESCTYGSARGALSNERPYRYRRRAFITLLGGAAAWPLAARAQQGERMRRIGWLAGTAKGRGRIASQLDAFKRAIADLGWIEGRNLAFEERWADNDPERLPPLAAELVAARPDLIFAVTSLMLAGVPAWRNIPSPFVAAPKIR
jgi:putative ABC transport system substrate-binding protein